MHPLNVFLMPISKLFLYYNNHMALLSSVIFLSRPKIKNHMPMEFLWSISHKYVLFNNNTILTCYMYAKKLKLWILCVAENVFLESHICNSKAFCSCCSYSCFPILATGDYTCSTYCSRTHFIIHIINTGNEKNQS